METYLRATEFDLIHHHALWLRTLHYARAKALRDGIPLVVSPRGMMTPWAWRHHRMRKIFAEYFIHPGAFKAVSGWHATSPEEAEEIRQLGFSQPICVAPNGVDEPEENRLTAAKQHWEAKSPALSSARVAVFYSRFHQKKRVIELIDLWAATAPADWLLLLVGVPEQFSIAQLQNYVTRTPRRSRIEVYDGAGQPAPYAAASLFLLPSHSENFGLVIADAMAHGLPVLVTNSTPWSGVNERDVGWCVPWEHYGETLRQALAETPDRLRERGRHAREWVLRDYSWEKSAGLLGEFYETLRHPTR
jgi:glycosyltransferase involved in cell wall biosynthesis